MPLNAQFAQVKHHILIFLFLPENIFSGHCICSKISHSRQTQWWLVHTQEKKWFIDLCVMDENTYLSSMHVRNNSNKYLEKTSRSLHIYIYTRTFSPSVHFSLLNNYVHNAEFESVFSIDDHQTSIRWINH